MFDYNDYPIELKIFRATVLKAKMLQVQAQNNRNNHKWLKYVNSSRNRTQFAIWIIHSFYADRSITAALVTTETGISRKAVDEMIKDWEAEGWLYKEKGEGVHKHKFFLHPNQEILHINDEWFQWYEEEILPMIKKTFSYYTASKMSIKQLQHESEFNTNSGSNLSGIEDTVTRLILKSSKEQRAEG